MALSKVNPNFLNVSQVGGRRNLIINGAMQVAQRGTSQTASSTSAFWGVDRFAFQTNANTNSTIEQSTDVPTNQGFKYSFKLTNGTAYTPTGSDFGRIYTRLEGYDVNHMNLGTASSSAFTLSFWVKSSLTGTFGGMFGGNGNGIYVFSYSISAANTWEKKTITVPSGTITTYGGNTTNGQGWQVSWDMGEGPDRSNAAGWHSAQPESEMGLTSGVKVVSTTSATWQITGVQLEVGDTATPFEHRSYGEELSLCQRYYQNINVPQDYSDGVSNTNIYRSYLLPTTMRVDGTASIFSQISYFQGGSGVNTTPTVGAYTDRVRIAATGLSSPAKGLVGGVVALDAEL